MKTIILAAFGRSRKFKQVGLATAAGSAHTIKNLREMARRGDARLAIVDADSVEHARQIIGTTVTPNLTLDNGKTNRYGATAAEAVYGASEVIANWNTNLQRQGRVYNDQTRAVKK